MTSPDNETSVERERYSDLLTAARLAKVEDARAAGIDPYPVRFDRSALAGDLHEAYRALGPGEATGEAVAVAGRIMLRRSFGKLAFLTIEDVSGRIQLMASLGDLPADVFARSTNSTSGDWVGRYR